MLRRLNTAVVRLLRCKRPGIRLRAALRVLAFFSVLSTISCFFLLKTAHAEAEKRVQVLGDRLLKQLGPLVLEDPASLTFNGQQMYFGSSITELGPQEVLQKFERYCHEHSGGLAQAIGQLPSRLEGERVPDKVRDPARWLTQRSDAKQGDVGEIVCFAREDRGSLKGLFARLGRFIDTGDLAELGDMRYVVARRATEKSTLLLAIWTDGSFKLADMFPESGDVPGTDSRNVPRPPQALRLLSAEFRGQPYAVRIYESKAEPTLVLRFYDQQMSTRGYVAQAIWKERASDRGLTASPTYARAFTKDGATIIVSALTEPIYQEGTQVAVAELGTRGLVHAQAGASIP